MGLPFCDIYGDRVPSGDDIKSIANFLFGQEPRYWRMR